MADDMTCPDCDTARITHPWGGYRVGCPECEARAVAQSPMYADAAAAGSVRGEYAKALAALSFGGIGPAHLAVKGWRSVLDALAHEPAVGVVQRGRDTDEAPQTDDVSLIPCNGTNGAVP